MKFLCISLFSLMLCPFVSGQDYLKKNAVPLDLSAPLSDSIYTLLNPYQCIMSGEMHGTNEPAQWVEALAKLFAGKGDSVQVGLEIPPVLMDSFRVRRTESSIYASTFFARPAFRSGRESYAWAHVIAALYTNPLIKIFFFDVNPGEDASLDRDSMMYLNLRKQYLEHPDWKMLTLSGNIHNMTFPQERLGRNTMASFFIQDNSLHLADKACSLNTYYLKGSCRANFGHGLEDHPLDRPENAYDTTLPFHQYILLMAQGSHYPYTGFFYTRDISPAKMVQE